MGEFIRLVAATLLGAGVAFLAQYTLARRQEQRADLDAHRRDEREMRRASRLVFEELLTVAAQLEAALDTRRWWSNPPDDLSIELWREHRTFLAGSIEADRTWDTLAMAYNAVAAFNLLLYSGRIRLATYNDTMEQDRLPFLGGDNSIDDVWADDIARLKAEVDAGVEAIRPRARAAFRVKELDPSE